MSTFGAFGLAVFERAGFGLPLTAGFDVFRAMWSQVPAKKACFTVQALDDHVFCASCASRRPVQSRLVKENRSMSIDRYQCSGLLVRVDFKSILASNTVFLRAPFDQFFWSRGAQFSHRFTSVGFIELAQPPVRMCLCRASGFSAASSLKDVSTNLLSPLFLMHRGSCGTARSSPHQSLSAKLFLIRHGKTRTYALLDYLVAGLRA